MRKHLESIGYGLFAAGVWLVLLAYLGAYMQEGLAGLAETLNPFALRNYFMLLALAPGFILIRVGRKRSRS